MKKKIILVGGGGHCKACIDVLEQEGKFKISGIVDRKENISKKILGYEVVGCDEDLPRLATKYRYFLITIGQVESAQKRIEKYQLIQQSGGIFPVIQSPLAYVSRHASVGEGTIIFHGAVLNAGAKVGKNCIINTSAVVEHDAQVGNHVHISTACTVNGGSVINDRCFLGSGAVLFQGLVISEDIVIGAGTIVNHSLSERGVYVGNPAKKIK